MTSIVILIIASCFISSHLGLSSLLSVSGLPPGCWLLLGRLVGSLWRESFVVCSLEVLVDTCLTRHSNSIAIFVNKIIIINSIHKTISHFIPILSLAAHNILSIDFSMFHVIKRIQEYYSYCSSNNPTNNHLSSFIDG